LQYAAAYTFSEVWNLYLCKKFIYLSNLTDTGSFYFGILLLRREIYFLVLDHYQAVRDFFNLYEYSFFNLLVSIIFLNIIHRTNIFLILTKKFPYWKVSARIFFSNFFGARTFFLSVFPARFLFLLFPHPHHFSNGPPLIQTGKNLTTCEQDVFATGLYSKLVNKL
jgi:hypothetical protein